MIQLDTYLLHVQANLLEIQRPQLIMCSVGFSAKLPPRATGLQVNYWAQLSTPEVSSDPVATLLVGWSNTLGLMVRKVDVNEKVPYWLGDLLMRTFRGLPSQGGVADLDVESMEHLTEGLQR